MLASGAMGGLMFPTVLINHHLPDLGFLAWVYLVPLFLVQNRLKNSAFFLLSWLVAMIFYGIGLYWLHPAMVDFGGLDPLVSVAVLILLLSILASYFSFALLLATWVHRCLGGPQIFYNAVFLLVADFARSHFPCGGFPWTMAAYSQGEYLSFFQWLEWTGVFGLNLLIFLVNGFVADISQALFVRGRKDILINRLLVMALILIVSFFVSLYCAQKTKNGSGDALDLTVALAEGNIPQDFKWDPESARSHLETYMGQTLFAEQSGADLVIWPETAYPYTVDLADPAALFIPGAEGLNIPILLGAVGQDAVSLFQEPILYNSAFLLSRDGMQVYHKRHLVPFGEYVPFKRWLFFARHLTSAVGDFASGGDDRPIVLHHVPLGVLICYEDIFPDLARFSVLAGAEILVNMTNDAWYGDTSAQFQHLVYSQFRALENRRYLARATNTGVTALIDPRGQVVKKLKPFVREVLIGKVIPEKRLTLYTRYGDSIAWVCVVLGLVVTGAAIKNKIKSRVSA